MQSNSASETGGWVTIKVGEGTRIGWIGAGRMGAAPATRLLGAGFDVAVYNRTKAKAEALSEHGATVVDRPAELADRDVVFSMVSACKENLEQRDWAIEL
jgi:3-hydroxyisobutyrate dehydrogenase